MQILVCLIVPSCRMVKESCWLFRKEFVLQIMRTSFLNSNFFQLFLARLYINYCNLNLQVLHVANIGDSGFMVIRNGAVLKRSSSIVYDFNFRLQIKRGDNPSDFIEVHQIKFICCPTKSSK